MAEVDISKEFDPTDGGMHYWNTPDDLGHVSFSINGNTMHVDFLRNQDEFDPSDKGPTVNMVAILRELRKYLREHPEITRITANVQNRDVKQWLLGLGARILRGGSIPVMELPVASVIR